MKIKKINFGEHDFIVMPDEVPSVFHNVDVSIKNCIILNHNEYYYLLEDAIEAAFKCHNVEYSIENISIVPEPDSNTVYIIFRKPITLMVLVVLCQFFDIPPVESIYGVDNGGITLSFKIEE